MIFDNVKVGDKFLEKHSNRILTITELTEKGLKYTCEPYSIKIGYDAGIPQLGMVSGGELLIKEPLTAYYWDQNYEKVASVTISYSGNTIFSGNTKYYRIG